MSAGLGPAAIRSNLNTLQIPLISRASSRKNRLPLFCSALLRVSILKGRKHGLRSIVNNAAGQIPPNEKRRSSLAAGAAARRSAQENRRMGINSNRGSVSGAIDLDTIIARSGANTGIAARGVCASACVMLWRNCAVKSAVSHSQIGVQNASGELADGSRTDAYSYGVKPAEEDRITSS
jgi:hypothetical protein